VWHVPADGAALALSIVKKAERFAVGTASPLEPLLGYDWPSCTLVDSQMISDDRLARALAVLHFDHDGAYLAAGSKLLRTPAAIPGMAQTMLEALRQKIEYVE